MTGRLILLAHAETEATRTAAFPLDEPLIARGRLAAEHSAATLPRHVRAWCSPALAAQETSVAFSCAAEIDPTLADLDCGRWRGRTLGSVADAEPEDLRAWLADPTYDGHGGTSIDALLGRVADWLTARREDRGVTIAITHAAIVRCAVLATIGAPASGFWHIDVAPLTRLVLSSDGRRWTLRGLQPFETLSSDQAKP